MPARRGESNLAAVPATFRLGNMAPTPVLAAATGTGSSRGIFARPFWPFALLSALALGGLLIGQPEDAGQLAVVEQLASVEPGAGEREVELRASPSAQAPDLLALATREIEERQAALAAREREVAASEDALHALAKALKAELAALADLRAQHDQEKQRRDQEQAERTERLARLYEAMKPKKAASILDGLPAEEAAQITRLMRNDKAAAAMQQMEPEQATALSEQLAKE
ncbi:MAG TPA: hypothetical protein VHL31_25435 [Geminicoccus sp.]|jgi:flagellar motility protein MotE (MotC chaperone)|uniref:MotE family protein n=1 Tax=Geminicoccus sp. TaxID=2024832 RepID=UPI002E339DB2|nr:hypothetical protein [Geminicoccus sp.]HEX2529619.1 hypothetical protein [Geminicoccus sp.]